MTDSRGYCRACKTERRFRFAGWAADGSENGVRPRAEVRICRHCGFVVLSLGNVHDTEGLCRGIARKRLDGVPGADLEDAAAFLQAEVWKLYLKWNPSEHEWSTFMGYANRWLPVRLGKWIIEVTGRDDRRRDPKAHAVSDPLDHALELGVSADGAFRDAADDAGLELRGFVVALGGDQADAAHYLAGDLGGILDC